MQEVLSDHWLNVDWPRQLFLRVGGHGHLHNIIGHGFIFKNQILWGYHSCSCLSVSVCEALCVTDPHHFNLIGKFMDKSIGVPYANRNL